MKNIIIFYLLLAFAIVSKAYPQNDGAYSIISVSGRIVDKNSGRDFQVGEKVLLQTTLQFGTSSDRAILISPARDRYRLELHPASSKLMVPSCQALHKINNRPQLVTRSRGMALTSRGISVNVLMSYFETDTFTVIGNTLKIPVRERDAEKFDLLLLRYGEGEIEEILFPDFIIQFQEINSLHIGECGIVLREGEIENHVKRITLYFVSEATLFAEFTALLASLDIAKEDTPTGRNELKQYCADVYGTMDEEQLNRTVTRFFDGAEPEKMLPD